MFASEPNVDIGIFLCLISFHFCSEEKQKRQFMQQGDLDGGVFDGHSAPMIRSNLVELSILTKQVLRLEELK